MATYTEQSDYVLSQLRDQAQNKLAVIEHVLTVLNSQLAVLAGIVDMLNHDGSSIEADETPAP
jgi:hypothetical protein